MNCLSVETFYTTKKGKFYCTQKRTIWNQTFRNELFISENVLCYFKKKDRWNLEPNLKDIAADHLLLQRVREWQVEEIVREHLHNQPFRIFLHAW